jgi:predicted methyltransferase MtxX (methanogen marker protein 4)
MLKTILRQPKRRGNADVSEMLSEGKRALKLKMKRLPIILAEPPTARRALSPVQIIESITVRLSTH